MRIDMDDSIYKHIFEEIITMTDDGFVVVDENGIITEMNEQYCHFIKMPREEIIGRKIEEVLKTTNLPYLMAVKGREKGQIIKIGEDIGFSEDMLTIVNRGAVCDENNNVIGGVAQVKFRIQTVDSAEKLTEKYNELEFYREEYFKIKNDRSYFDEAVGSSIAFETVKIQGLKAARTSFPVLLTGETGTGKEVFANAIHNASTRSDKPMVSINCAAIPGELLESELFGYEEGSFTGAKKGGKKGKIELANEGTLFLDEIGDMPLKMQAKLLRVLQEKEIEKVGGYKSIPVDIRIIAATRRNLDEMIENGEFREDLYYRLNVINVEMPPLRKRKDDIPLLAKHFLDLLNKEYKTKIVLSKEVLEYFRKYSWPGNIRELDNVIKSAYAACDSFRIRIIDLPQKIVASGKEELHGERNAKKLAEYMHEYEKSIIMEELRRNNWNCGDTAEELGIHKSLLYKKIARYEINLDKERYESTK